MPAPELPLEIRAFLSKYIRTVEELEILLHLACRPSALLSAADVYEAVLSTPQSVERWLNELVRCGLLEKSDSDKYRCFSDDSLRSRMEELAKCYRITPVRVIEAIYKPKADAAQSFADAFKIKQPHENI